jgi:hypothetical protein
MSLMPNCTIIWSSILPRKEWRYANNNDAAVFFINSMAT